MESGGWSWPTLIPPNVFYFDMTGGQIDAVQSERNFRSLETGPETSNEVAQHRGECADSARVALFGDRDERACEGH
jgi:hypothetical protein